MLRTITDMPPLKGARVLLRTDFNVPFNSDGSIEDDFRVRKALPTIMHLRSMGAKVIILSHVGRGSDSLAPIASSLSESMPVVFEKEYLEDGVMARIDALPEGGVMLCENIRIHDSEKNNDDEFARRLSRLGEYFVNDAFSVSHRAHASIVGIPKYLPSYAGIQLGLEIENLSRALSAPHPFVCILGGAKFETKIPLIKKFIDKADTIYVGGALANYFLHKKGYEVGESLLPEEEFDITGIFESGKLMLPTDVVTHDTQGDETKLSREVDASEKILDVGGTSENELFARIASAAFVLWNGPLGYFEGGYDTATLDLARRLAESGVPSVVGGGDTLGAIKRLQSEDKFTFISTGGGAMLEFLIDETSVGIEALKTSPVL